MAPKVKYSCKVRLDQFCYVCARYVKVRSRYNFSETLQKRYQDVFNVSCKNLKRSFTPNTICSTCSNKLRLHLKKEAPIKMTPAIWHQPKDKNHKDCYICNTNLTLFEKKKPFKFEYSNKYSVELPKPIQEMNLDDYEDSDTDDLSDGGSSMMNGPVSKK